MSDNADQTRLLELLEASDAVELGDFRAAVSRSILMSSIIPAADFGRIYRIRAGHLGERGVDVTGMNSAIEYAERGEPDAVRVAAAEDRQSRFVAFTDPAMTSLVGWVTIPLELAPLAESTD